MVTITSRAPARPVSYPLVQLLRACAAFYLEVLPGRFGWPAAGALYIAIALFGVAGLALGTAL